MRGVLALVVLCGVARADNAADALIELDRGIALFQNNDLTAAREAFVKARDLVPEKANPYRWLGLVDARLGRCKEAIDELEVFLKRAPLNDTRAIEAITVRDRCKDELQPKLGTLIVDSTPPGAEVRIDNPDAPAAGKTPFRAELGVGSHLVFLMGPGFQQTVKSVAIGRNETVRLDLTLQVQPASAAPATAPVAPAVAAAPPPTTKKKSKLWAIIGGVVVGVVAVAALGAGLGVGLSGGKSADTQLPPVSAR
jgi:hypothetical protein